MTTLNTQADEENMSLVVHEKLTATARRLVVDVTPTTSKRMVVTALRNWCTELGNSLQDAERIKLVVGKILLVVADRKLYEPEYTSLDDFLQAEVLDRLEREGLKLSRSTAMEGYQVVRVMKERATPQAYAVLGSTNMTLAARALKKNPPPSVRRRLEGMLTNPAPITIAKMRELVGSVLSPKGGNGQHASETEIVSLRLSPETAQSWRDLLTHPRVAEKAGGETVDAVFSWAVELAIFSLGGTGTRRRAAARAGPPPLRARAAGA